MNVIWKYGMLATSVVGVVLLIDRSWMCDWVGDTNLDVIIRVTDAATGEAIAKAKIDVKAEVAKAPTDEFSESATDHMHHASFITDASGDRRVHCERVICSGTQSYLLFTNTNVVCRPDWIIDVHAAGYESLKGLVVRDPKNPLPVRPIGPRLNEMVIPISMKSLTHP